MDIEPTCKLQLQENLCVNTEKVYDWIIEQSTGSSSIPVASLPTLLPADATNVVARCILTDAAGVPLPTNAEIDVTEAAPREDQQFEINGTPVTLQRVTFTKTLYVVLEITGVDPATGTQFLITSNPTSFRFIETAFLCAPVGTTLVVRVSNFSCLTVIIRDATDAITAFGLNIFVCQSIQMIAPVTINLTADFCKPREVLSEQCVSPSIPPQCPVVFPGT